MVTVVSNGEVKYQSPPLLSLSDNTSVDNTTDNDNDDDNLDNNNAINNNYWQQQEQAPQHGKDCRHTKTKATASAPKKAGTKMTGEDVRVTNRAAAYFLTKTLKGYLINHYSKGSKNYIDVVSTKVAFHPRGPSP